MGMKTHTAINIGSAGDAPVNAWKAGGEYLAHYLGPLNGSLTFAILCVLFCLGIMGILYRRKIFIKL